VSEKPGVVKVKAFPFPVTIKNGANVIPGEVVRMSGLGIMAEIQSGMIAVGDKPDIEFTLPVVKDVIMCQGLVVKFLQQVNRPRLTEIHFKNLPEELRAKVLHYLTAAGVKP
jgi:hypothetical protein